MVLFILLKQQIIFEGYSTSVNHIEVYILEMYPEKETEDRTKPKIKNNLLDKIDREVKI